MIFTLTACSDSGNSSGSVPAAPTVSANTSNNTSLAGTNDNSSYVPQNSSTDVSAPESEPANDENSVPEQPADLPQESTPEITAPEAGSPKVLVAYFSATNTTKGVALDIADALNADVYEITPSEPYSSADLDYHNDKSRSSVEMNDSSARPAISGSVSNMDQYDIVFVGYPIWWGEAPRIMSTFVESCSFSGKTVVPFCTSASSGVGSSASNLANQANGGDWKSGTRFGGGESRGSLVDWINGLWLGVTAE